jgi:inorganic triphosphatase YgiF
MPLERELKLTPADPALLDRLEALEVLGPFAVVSRSRERQRNAFFDTPARALQAARLGFRRRTIAGTSLAIWTLKGAGLMHHGVAARPEVEVRLDADTPPALALAVLGRAAREWRNAALAEQLGDALAGSPPPTTKPYLELETDRRLLQLDATAEGWAAEMALDRVRMVGHEYAEMEIEVELRRGGDEALEAARREIAALGAVQPATGSKLARALAHLRGA